MHLRRSPLLIPECFGLLRRRLLSLLLLLSSSEIPPPLSASSLRSLGGFGPYKERDWEFLGPS